MDLKPRRRPPFFRRQIVESSCLKKFNIFLELYVFSLQSRKAGWSWGCVSAVDSQGRTIWIADAHHGDGKRFVVRAEELLTAFWELEQAVSQNSCAQT
jgi:hypothetical protein